MLVLRKILCYSGRLLQYKHILVRSKNLQRKVILCNVTEIGTEPHPFILRASTRHWPDANTVQKCLLLCDVLLFSLRLCFLCQNMKTSILEDRSVDSIVQQYVQIYGTSRIRKR